MAQGAPRESLNPSHQVPRLDGLAQWLLANKDTHRLQGGPMLLGIALP